jgi:hypothetical protein
MKGPPTTSIFSNMVENTEHGPMAFKFPNPEGTTNQHECTNQKMKYHII